MSIKFGTGYLESTHDSRDMVFRDRFAVLETAGRIMLPTRPPLDQGQTMSCVGHAWARWITTIGDIHGIDTDREPSPWWLYLQGLLVRTDGHWDWLERCVTEGTTPRSVAKMLHHSGVPQTDLVELGSLDRPTVGILEDCYDHRTRLDLYMQCQGSAEISSALHRGMPVVIGLRVGDDWHHPVSPLSYPSRVTGGHCVLVVGEDGDGNFIILNSWGDGWRDPSLPPGHARITRSYADTASDCWTGLLGWRPAND